MHNLADLQLFARTIKQKAKPKATFEGSAVKNKDYATVHVYDSIMPFWGVDLTYFRQHLETPEAEKAPGINLRIASGGGDVFETWGIIGYLLSKEKPIDVYVDGLAASSAGILALVGTRRFAHNLSAYMIHAPYVIGGFNKKRLSNTAEDLARLEEQLIYFTALRTKMLPKQVREFYNNDLDNYLYVDDMVKYGIVDKVLDYAVDIPQEPSKDD